uniref:Uncharacterized protein n=1 Tax=Auxenochlorella protothecoides TaxID=3075 RepID=A0A1D2A384_AUXPR
MQSQGSPQVHCCEVQPSASATKEGVSHSPQEDVSPSPQEGVSPSPQEDVSLSPQQDVSLSPSKEHVSSSTTISEITSSTFPPLSSPLSASALAFSPLPSAVSSSPLPAALSPPTPVPTLPTASSANTDPGYRQNCVLHYQVHHHLDIQLPNGVGVC